MPKKGEKKGAKNAMEQNRGKIDKTDKTVEELEKRMGEGKEMVVSVLDKMNTLFTSGLGLVAALAWNEAVKDIFDQAFADQDRNSIWAKTGYAVVVTIIIVIVTYKLTKLIERIKKQSGVEEKIKKEKE